ncbi:MAG: hypothetical protein WC848_05355 [Parcubacteria group bacterium]|jgi:hypothetical protein
MNDWLNNHQGLLAIISVGITIIGFFITNKNITNKKQVQKSGKNSQNNQAGRDIDIK